MGDLTKTTTVLQRFDDRRHPGRLGFRHLGDVEEELRSHLVFIDPAVWRDMGEPSVITVTIEPGDRLNAGGGLAETAGMPADHYVNVEHFDTRASGDPAGEKGTTQ
jgi:hypothetical protein